ncbi:uncharacterized protein LOC143021827 [Oratosquilla oratoria]|uniref:uncharacterized protein LOC143021827 n=1 Tax=Oratosquilla oratoria TaxID=337810 RepID=UPI003F76225A
MGVRENELEELKKCVERVISNCTLETCVAAMVRINIQRTKYKQIVCCFQFPDEYPKYPILTELKSHHISQKLLDGLVKICDEEAKKRLGKPQILQIIKLVSNFIDENPLCCCSEEITNIRKTWIEGSDELKLRQKTSSLLLKVNEGSYFIKYSIFIPENYPEKQVGIEAKESNFPAVFQRWFTAQSVEIARRCIEPPLKKKPKDPPFVLKPSMEPVVSFLIKEAHAFPRQTCKVCGEKAFPEDARNIHHDESSPKHVERILCGHIYHNACLDKYIKTPPFQGGKKCHTCGQQIFHEKWKITQKLAEERWAHKQAKQRELDEVVDFLS